MIVMRRFLFWGVWALVMLCCCCTGNQVYDHYQNVPISGWDKADVLSYDVAALRDSGWYATDLGLRMNNMYPFLSVTMVVSQAVYHPDDPIPETVLYCRRYAGSRKNLDSNA